MRETTPRIIQRISVESHDGYGRQTVVRTSSGAIDYDYYYARAREERSEAFAELFGSIRQAIRQVFCRLRRGRQEGSCRRRTASCG